MMLSYDGDDFLWKGLICKKKKDKMNMCCFVMINKITAVNFMRERNTTNMEKIIRRFVGSWDDLIQFRIGGGGEEEVRR